MYTLDCRIPSGQVYPLGEAFSGTDPKGHRLGFTNSFMTLDGKPFFAISGEMHYCRVSPDQWEDSLIKMQGAGINIVSTYVFWNVHEEEEGVFRFDGCRDLARFLTLCEKYHLWVILRIGPFNHGEMRNGGLPDWLYGKPYEVRENNPAFLDAVRKLFRAVHGQADGHYYSQGGCIIGTQIENEYQHSSAPWEITTGTSGEWINAGSSGDAYMLALKRILLEEGIQTPFYTATAWGGAAVPTEEALPLWGGYAYQPWLFYNKAGIHPPTPEYIYRDNHNNAAGKQYNFDPRYEPESRPYACCEMMGGMMCSYQYRFQLDMRSVDALANIKLGSGCNFPGYYMFRGGTTPAGKVSPYLNEGQLPKRSYDYQAAIGEFGQIRESYGRLKALHSLCRLFSGFLENTVTVLPEHMKDLQPEDRKPLRFAVRVRDRSGFLFVNNFQDHLDMPDREDEEVRLQLPGEELVFRFSLASGENAILPFGLNLGPSRLDWATAQPLAHVGSTWFFLIPDGMAPAYCIDGTVYRPAVGEAFRIGTETVMSLSRKDSKGFTVAGGQAWLCEKPLLQHDGHLTLETDGTDADVLCWQNASGRFEKFRRIQGSPAHDLHPHSVGKGRFTFTIPDELLSGHKQVLLRIRYLGDIGQFFLRNELLSDNFCNGGDWDIRLDSAAQTLKTEAPVLYITPVRDHVTVDASAMAGRKEQADIREAALLSARLVFVDEVPIAEIPE